MLGKTPITYVFTKCMQLEGEYDTDHRHHLHIIKQIKLAPKRKYRQFYVFGGKIIKVSTFIMFPTEF